MAPRASWSSSARRPDAGRDARSLARTGDLPPPALEARPEALPDGRSVGPACVRPPPPVAAQRLRGWGREAAAVARW